MSNKFLTDDIIVKEALRLLVNNCVTLSLVYRDYEKRFGKVGDTISLELPYRTKTAAGPVLQLQPLVDLSEPFKINNHEHFGLDFSQKARRLEIQNFSSRYLHSGMVQLGNVVDRSVLLTLRNVFFSTGIPGTTPGNYLAWATAGAYQTDLAVPNDGMRRAVVNPITCAVLSDQFKNLNNSKGLDTIVPKGYKGDVYDYSFHETQNLPTHTVGTYTGSTPLIDGASQTGTSIVTDGWAVSTKVLNAGDVIRIGGVHSVNPQNYETTGHLMQFVVQNDVTSTAGGAATIVVNQINDGTLTTTNETGDVISLQAYQNVTNAPADNAAIEVMGQSGATYRQDYLFHKEAIALAMIDFELPETAVVAKRVRDPETGASMTLTGFFDGINYRQVYRIDVMWGVHLIYPELAMRMWGASPESL